MPLPYRAYSNVVTSSMRAMQPSQVHALLKPPVVECDHLQAPSSRSTSTLDWTPWQMYCSTPPPPATHHCSAPHWHCCVTHSPHNGSSRLAAVAALQCCQRQHWGIWRRLRQLCCRLSPLKKQQRQQQQQVAVVQSCSRPQTNSSPMSCVAGRVTAGPMTPRLHCVK
jgi:hypothetical protein